MKQDSGSEVTGSLRVELVGDGQRPLDEMSRKDILEANDALAGRALRTLGVAYRSSLDGTLTPASLRPDAECDLVFAGLIGMIDPLRDEARDAVPVRDSQASQQTTPVNQEKTDALWLRFIMAL